MTYAKRRMSTIPRKKLGKETPARVTLVETRSTIEFRLTAEMIPTTSAIETEKKSAASPSSTVAGRRSHTASRTRWWVSKDLPRSPLTRWLSQTTYCTGSGLSSPIWVSSALIVAGIL